MQSMSGKIRAIDGRYIRLSGPLRSHVEHLARLAGVTASDVVTFALTEAFEDGALRPPAPADVPPQPAPLPARPRRRADVIPITRARSSGPRWVLECLDASYLRRQAADLRKIARAVRARAAQACHNADDARARSTNALKPAGV
jgi:hypothetical protein